MEIEIKTKSGKKIERIEIKKRDEIFSISVNEKPKKITFDPDERIPLKTIKIEKLDDND